LINHSADSLPLPKLGDGDTDVAGRVTQGAVTEGRGEGSRSSLGAFSPQGEKEQKALFVRRTAA